jgi:RNA ligase
MKGILDGLVEEGWLVSQDHPTLDLTIYNYSQKTQYESNWNEWTLMCRGLVVNSKGDIVARPFGKFFNWEEVSDKVPANESYEIYEKVDGSLGIFFWYMNEDGMHPVFASRGSFTSDQAIKGWEMLQKLPYRDLHPFHTHMFEIIYPENRIVLDYGSKEKLVLLGIINNSSAREVDRKYIEYNLQDSFELVKVYHLTDGWEALKSLNEPNKEGFVIKFENGFRMKIKFEDYVRLHRIITQISNIDIWERLMKGEPLDELLDKVPDEFYDWVRKTIKELVSSYSFLENEYKWIFKIVNRSAKDRKHFAEMALRYKHPSLLFNMYDGKDYSQVIWKLVRPAWSKPFSNVEN